MEEGGGIHFAKFEGSIRKSVIGTIEWSPASLSRPEPPEKRWTV